jgi:hypothetical protein
VAEALAVVLNWFFENEHDLRKIISAYMGGPPVANHYPVHQLQTAPDTIFS